VNTQEYINSGIVESYVLGLASPDEVQELMQQMKLYPEIKQAVEDFEVAIEANNQQNTMPVPPHVKNNLFSMLENEFSPSVDIENATAAKVVSINNPLPQEDVATAKVKSIINWQILSVAAILLLIVSACLNIYFYNSAKTSANQYQALLTERSSLQANIEVYQTKLEEMDNGMKTMLNPAMKIVKMPAVKGMEGNAATVYWDTSTKDVYVLNNALAPVATDKQYQLWAIVDGKPVDAGMLGDCAILCKMKNIPNAQAFAITLEKKGGNPSPQGTMYVLGKI
jgi:anti-sigma-K factor RskA